MTCAGFVHSLSLVLATSSPTSLTAERVTGMLTYRGFSAWIMVDGKPLPEYLVAVDNKTHRISCWIPSEEGQVR
jgi:type VI protein secretion system component VasK